LVAVNGRRNSIKITYSAGINYQTRFCDY
jgi:hypothetical protein